mmetsp:Transcript_36267/g.61154  ORF Transcript_36267/g.61154 Transcript_36267/m.61154 type:complete len:212 (-) Transcript_36267:1144-1779(-)
MDRHNQIVLFENVHVLCPSLHSLVHLSWGHSLALQFLEKETVEKIEACSVFRTHLVYESFKPQVDDGVVEELLLLEALQVVCRHFHCVRILHIRVHRFESFEFLGKGRVGRKLRVRNPIGYADTVLLFSVIFTIRGSRFAKRVETSLVIAVVFRSRVQRHGFVLGAADIIHRRGRGLRSLFAGSSRLDGGLCRGVGARNCSLSAAHAVSMP